MDRTTLFFSPPTWHDFVLDRQSETIIYWCLLALIIVWATWFIRRRRTEIPSYFTAALTYAVLAITFAVALAADLFDWMRLLAFAVFGGGTLLALIIGITARTKFKVVATFFLLCATALPLIALDAFILEPHDLQITHYSLKSKRLPRPIRIGVLSDLQTDRVSSYERYAIQTLLAQKPDLILLPGDYIQGLTFATQMQEMHKLRDLLREQNVSAPLGVYAVHGNTESDQRREIFVGTSVIPIPQLSTVTTKDVDITGMSLEQSFDTQLKITRPCAEKFHIAFGHAPDFSLGNIDADLLVAGHTHGGQVQLPFFGPLITLSQVDRGLAKGAKIDTDEKIVIVSRGVGMERRYAPRLRFLCKPEIVIVEAMPNSPL